MGSATSGIGRFLKFAILAIVFLALVVTNPSEADIREQVANDGWVPIGFERTNLLAFSVIKINGFTGAKATYVAVAGQVFKLSDS